MNNKLLLLPVLITGSLLCNTALAANQRPAADKQSISINEDSTDNAITLTATDADGDALTYHVVRKPRKGTLTQASPGSASFTYTPKPNYSGRDRFLFRAKDGASASTLAVVSISVQDVADAPPTVADIVTSGKENKSVTIKLLGAGGSGSTLRYTATDPAHGSVSIRRDRATYKPDANFNGSDSFTYTATDGSGTSEAASVSISIAAVNTAPEAQNQAVEVPLDTTTAITLVGSDAEDADPAFAVVRKPLHGSLNSLVGSSLSYTPESGYQGADSFSFRLTDSEGLRSRLATVNLKMVDAVDPEPEPEPEPKITGKLNDTGITTCADSGASGTYNTKLDCEEEDPQGDAIPLGQDADYGRDATHNDDSDGHAGFSFTKLDASGGELPANAGSWNCVKDNVTGLIWEVKTTDAGLHDRNDRYNWYNTNPLTNGGSDGFADRYGAICHGYSNADSSTWCNTEAYVQRVNTAGWCGASDWRMPEVNELQGIADLSRASPSIDTTYFLNTIPNRVYWSGTAYAGSSSGAWFVDFGNGYDGWSYRSYDAAVRLVRSGQ